MAEDSGADAGQTPPPCRFRCGSSVLVSGGMTMAASSMLLMGDSLL